MPCYAVSARISSSSSLALFHKYGVIEHESYEESYVHLCGSLPQNQSGPFLAFQKKKLAKRQR